MNIRKIGGWSLLASPFVTIYFWAIFSLGHTWFSAAVPFMWLFALLSVIGTGFYLLNSEG